MKLGLKLWSINTDYYLNEARRLYDKGLYDYIELYAYPGTLNTIALWKSLNIPYTIHCPHSMHGFNLADKSKRGYNARIFDEVRTFADKLQTDYIIVHGGAEGEINETAEQFAALNEPRAIIENKPYRAIVNSYGINFCRGYNKEELQTVIEKAHCGFCLDFVHAACAANSQKRNIYDYIEDLGSLKPKMFHLSNMEDITSEYDSHIHLADGNLDIVRLLSMFSKEMKITLETKKIFKTSLQDFEEDINFIKKYK